MESALRFDYQNRRFIRIARKRNPEDQVTSLLPRHACGVPTTHSPNGGLHQASFAVELAWRWLAKQPSAEQ